MFRNSLIAPLITLISSVLFAATDPVEGTVELANGDKIHGKIIQHNDKTLTIEHPVLGTLTIENKKIAAILDSTEQAMPDEMLPDEPEDLGLFGSGMLTGWDRKFDFGLNGNITTLDWIHELDLYQGLAIKLGIYNEYDSNQTEDNRNDFRYHASLVWGL